MNVYAGTSYDKFMVIGFSVGSAIIGAVVVIMLVMITVGCYKCVSYLKGKRGKGNNSFYTGVIQPFDYRIL